MLTPRKADLFGTLDALAAVIPQEILALGLSERIRNNGRVERRLGKGGLCLRITCCYAEAGLESHLSRKLTAAV